MCTLFYKRGELSHNMIKSEVHLIEDKHFLVLTSHNSTILIVSFTIVTFDAGKLRVFNAYINTAHGKGDCVSFVSLKWTRNCKLILGISI